MVQSEEEVVSLMVAETEAIRTIHDVESFIMKWYLWKAQPDWTRKEKENAITYLVLWLIDSGHVQNLPCGCPPAIMVSLSDNVAMIDIKLSHPPGLVH